MSKQKSSKKKASWRDILNDGWIRSFPTRPDPESLHPNASTVERAISGDEEARAIADSYAFRFPVTTVTSLEVL
jgi:hypothetical protein